MASKQNRSQNQAEPTETTALLASSDEVPIHEEAVEDDADKTTRAPAAEDDKPLPKDQILFLCVARLFEPIAFFTIFPFVNQMIYDTGEVAETDVGFYSGLIESLFSLTQMMFMIPWGKLADNPRIGRKPVLVFTMIGNAICTALFGMSQTIWQMIVLRCSAGIFAGLVVTIRTMLAENSTPKTQARAFSWFAFTGNAGIFLGPLIGGALSDPTKNISSLFGSSTFFKHYPYALPTFASGAYGLIAAILCMVYVNETHRKKLDSTAAEPLTPTRTDTSDRLSLRQLLASPGVIPVLFLQAHIMILAFSYTAVFPVFQFTPIHLSGYSFTPFQISLFMGLGGAAQAIWLLLVFPPLQRKFGTGGVMRACAIYYPFFFVMYPLFNVFLKLHWTILFWTLAPIMYALGSGVSMSFTAIQLAINDVNPKPSTLGTLNSIALVLVSGIRGFSPALFTSIFALGVRKQILHGYLVWLVMIILAVGFTVDVRLLPPNAEGKADKKAADRDEEP